MEPDNLDPVRKLILEKAKDRKGGLNGLSLELGRNVTYLQQFVNRGMPKALNEADRHRLAQILDVDQRELAPAGLPLNQLSDRAPVPQNARMAGPRELLSTVPAYGQAAGGRDGQFVLNGNKIADILAPASLAGVRNAYAVYVVGDSMAPRYHSGEVVFVNPRLPVRRDDYVVAQIAADEGQPPEAYVKQFVSKDARYLTLKQLNPRKLLKFGAQRVVAVHRIIMGGDG